MKKSEVRIFVRTKIEQFAGRKATLSGTLLKQKFSISGMLSSTWQNSIPVCTVRGEDRNSASLAIPFDQIKNITETRKCFDDAELIKLDIDLEARDYYKHTGKNRIVFEFELKTGDKVELWLNTSEEYANTRNIIAKVEGTFVKSGN